MAHWQEMVWLIGRRWHGSLAIDGVAHRQEMAWLTDRKFFFGSLAADGVALKYPTVRQR